jgi:hypothetical protein
MKTFPYHPATMESYFPDGDVTLELERNFTWKEEDGPDYSYWVERDLGDAVRNLSFSKIITDTAGFLEAETPGGIRVIVRPYDQYDPVRMGVSAIPWPKSVAQDWMIGEDQIMLNALVDDNGDVATLLLDSPSTSYVRYTGQWFILSDLEAISDYDFVGVEDTALDLYDPADQAGKSVKITSMPVKPEEDFRVTVRYSGDPDADALKPIMSETIVASLTIPTIASVRDLPAAIEFAQEYPEFQWYVTRRAKALGIEESFPWND